MCLNIYDFHVHDYIAQRKTKQHLGSDDNRLTRTNVSFCKNHKKQGVRLQ